MKALDIINFINEDKFSKYTLQQIYDELGKEDFVDYLANLYLKAAKLEGLEMKLESPNLYTGSLSAHITLSKNIEKLHKNQKDATDILYLAYNSDGSMRMGAAIEFKGATIAESPGFYIAPSMTDLLKFLRHGIKREFNVEKLVDTRNTLQGKN